MQTPINLQERIGFIIRQIGRDQWLSSVASTRLEGLERVVLRFSRQIRTELLQRAALPPDHSHCGVNIPIRISGRARNLLQYIAKQHGGVRRISLSVISQLDPYELLRMKGIGRRTMLELRSVLSI